jgi:hypothetical protein
MRSTTGALSAALLAVCLLAGCGGDDSGDASEPTPTATSTPSDTPTTTQSPTPSPTEPAGVVIDATIRGDDIEPNGERVKVGLGEPVTINIDADRAGELHVHSTPEQELPYKVGKTTVELSFDTPGIIDVEDHVSDKLLVSLQVS